jgi:hypothetical protein
MNVDCRTRDALWSALGALCVASVLALTPTGVQIARAEDPPPLVAEEVGPSSIDPTLAAAGRQSVDAPVCRAGDPAVTEQRHRAQLQEQMLRVRQALARRAGEEAGSAASAEDVVVLNGRGYRYGD